MAIKQLNQTFVFNHLNQNGAINKAIMEIIQKGQVIKPEQIQEALLTIQKNFKFPLKIKVLEAFSKGEIKLVFAPQNVRIPTALPFFLMGDKTNINACVALDLFATMNKEGDVTVDAKKLYCLMESALIAKYCVTQPHLSERPYMMREGAEIWAHMFTRVLNKKYALNVDKNRFQKVLFLANKFFLLSILGLKNSEINTNYAIKNCVQANPFLLRELDEQVEIESYRDLSTFIQTLSRPELNLGMKDLTVRGYLEAFISMYDASALMALECLPYFLHNIFSVTHGAYLNNQYILEDIVDKKGAKIYNEIFMHLK